MVKSSFKKATKTKVAEIVITTELTPDYKKDYEVIPYSNDLAENELWIEDFMTKYIIKPFRYLDRNVGVEVNFNKLFYQPEELRELSKIIVDLEVLENDLKILENELSI